MAADQLNAVWPLGVEAMLSKKKIYPKTFRLAFAHRLGRTAEYI